MPNPTPGAVHVNGLLTNLSEAYVQAQDKFAAPRVFPLVQVSYKSDIVPRYDRGDFYRQNVQRRMVGDAPARSGYRTDNTLTYLAEEWALDHPVDDQLRANAKPPYNPEQDATVWLTQQMLLRMEEQFITNWFSTGNIWTGSSDAQDIVGGTDFTEWSNAASTPIEDLTQGGERIESQTGFLPNKLVVARKVWNDLKNHPDIIDRVKGTGSNDRPAVVSRRALAEVLELDEVVVAAGVQNTGGEGSTAADVFGHIAGDHALLVYAAPSPGLRQPSGGYTFQWTDLPNRGISQFRDKDEIGDVIRIRDAWDQLVVGSDLGAMFINASTR